ncbi:hypothetical protein Noda2021_05560 [Candidatus Dependentiae bacterium Noda2021]|nr:hypothetical protein Noda2021_05560 [Candidatus Dependentiae bacterium Noda2021]
MKYVLLSLLMTGSLCAMEQDPYVCARERWLDNDHMPQFFMSMIIASNSLFGQFSSKDSQEPLVKIDLRDQTITTYFVQDDQEKELIHTFRNFTNFINDQHLLKKAQKYRAIKRNLEIKCTIL